MYVKPRLLALDGMASLERLLRKVQDPLVVRHPRVVVVRVRPPDLGQVAQADDVLRPSVEEFRLVQDRADKPWRARERSVPYLPPFAGLGGLTVRADGLFLNAWILEYLLEPTWQS